MIKVDGNTISMTRGDTLRATITIKDSSGNTYTPSDGDTIKFTAKENYGSAKAAIEKTISNSTMTLHLAPEDTKKLKMPWTYVYDIQLTKSNGDVDTFISKQNLIITEEVG